MLLSKFLQILTLEGAAPLVFKKKNIMLKLHQTKSKFVPNSTKQNGNRVPEIRIKLLQHKNATFFRWEGYQNQEGRWINRINLNENLETPHLAPHYFLIYLVFIVKQEF